VEASVTRRSSPSNEEAPTSRIVDARWAAKFLGRDYYTIRRLALAGEIPLVRFPSVESLKKRRSLTARPVRRLLFDVRDLEQFITRCKAG
jgi:hypothetical protein